MDSEDESEYFVKHLESDALTPLFATFPNPIIIAAKKQHGTNACDCCTIEELVGSFTVTVAEDIS